MGYKHTFFFRFHQYPKRVLVVPFFGSQKGTSSTLFGTMFASWRDFLKTKITLFYSHFSLFLATTKRLCLFEWRTAPWKLRPGSQFYPSDLNSESGFHQYPMFSPRISFQWIWWEKLTPSEEFWTLLDLWYWKIIFWRRKDQDNLFSHILDTIGWLYPDPEKSEPHPIWNSERTSRPSLPISSSRRATSKNDLRKEK